MNGKIVLITGVSRGLGKDFYDAFLTTGATVIGVVRNINVLNELKNKYLKKPTAYFYDADLMSLEDVNFLINHLKESGMEPDIIVNNLGGTLSTNDPLQSLMGWRDVFRINLEVAVQLNEAFIPSMQKKKWGRICHISSISAIENQGPPAYCAAKAALNAYVRSLARYVAKDNVILTSVMPGAVFTEGGYWDEMSKIDPEYVNNYVSNRMAINRLGNVREITEAVLFLSSDKASFCVGTAMLIDGGQGRAFYE